MLGFEGELAWLAVYGLPAALVLTCLLAWFFVRQGQPPNRVAVQLAYSSTYDLQPIRAPALSGWALRLAVQVLQSPLAWPILRFVFAKNGISKVLRDTEMLDVPTFEPRWPTSLPAGLETCKIAKVPAGSSATAACSRVTSASLTTSGSRLMHKGSTLQTQSEKDRWQIADFHLVYSTGAASPRDVANNVIAASRTMRKQKPANCLLVSSSEQDILLQAAASHERYLQKQPLSPLDGVPYAVIDSIDAVPYATTAGTRRAMDTAQQDAPCITALRAAGAILIGKANLHEAGAGMTGLNAHYGPVRNPHNMQHMAGGSSSGCAALVAAGICPFAIGIDGGGSLRVPAAMCGVVGLRPTVGRTSHLACAPNAFSIMGFGPIAATVADAMIVYSVIANAGVDIERNQVPAVTLPQKLPSARASQEVLGLPNLRIGIFWPWFEDASPDVVQCCRQAVERLQNQTGCQIVEIDVPGLEMTRVAQQVAIGAELAAAYSRFISKRNRHHYLAPDTLATLLVSSQFTATDFIQAQKVRTVIMSTFARIFGEVDLIATPTVPVIAPVIGEGSLKGELNMGLANKLMRFTNAVNMAGLPAISVPVGQGAEGLPIGLQLIGRAWQEASLLHISSVLESLMHETRQLPQVYFNVLRTSSQQKAD